MIRSVILSLLASAALLSAAKAQPPEDGTAHFVEDLVAQLSSTASDSSLRPSERMARQRALLEEDLAVERIGKFLFSGAPAGLASESQRARYAELFPAYIAATFADQMGELAGRDIRIGDIVPRGQNEALAQSELVNDAGITKASIDWRVTWIEGEPYLLDVIVERVSPLVTKRQEFSALTRREGVDALLAHMAETVGDE